MSYQNETQALLTADIAVGQTRTNHRLVVGCTHELARRLTLLLRLTVESS